MALSVAILVIGQPFGPPVARATVTPSADQDHDLLPDAVERQLLLNPANPDTDGDGVPDGFEYAVHSDPADPLESDPIVPSFRMIATGHSGSAGKESVDLTLFFLPGTDEFTEAFSFFMYSPAFGLDGGSSWRGADLTRLLPQGISEVGIATFQGLTATSYTINIPVSFIEQAAPLSIGAAARIAGVASADTIYLDVIDGVPVMLHGLGVPGDDTFSDDDGLPWDPLVDEVPPDWGEQQICETKQEIVGLDEGLIIYEVSEADCKPTVNRFCYSDCPARVGQTITTVDYGFLIGLVSDD